MNLDRTHAPDDLIGDWLEEGPTGPPDRLLELVLAAIPSIPQRRRARRVPWRFPPVNGYARVLAVAAAAVIAALGGLIILNAAPSASRVAGSPAPVPNAAASSSPAPTATPLDTAGWTLFTSTRNGLTVRYPAGWTVTAATAPWPVGTDLPDPPNSPVFDVVSLPTNGDMTLTMVSQPVPRNTTALAWLTAYEHHFASYYADMPQCFPAPAAMQRMQVGGQSAYVHGGCGFSEAITFVGGRVYVLTWLAGDFGTDMFDALLSTVQFTPATANDRPGATACPRPGNRACRGASPLP